MPKKKNILVVVAHPDDEVLGCGGTIAKHIKAGDGVCVIALADGVTARVYDSRVPRKEELKIAKGRLAIREKEFFSAAKIMGIKKDRLFLCKLPDQRLDALPLLDIIKIIEKLAGETHFDLVYTHHWGDLNKDHRICFEAVLTAFRPSRRVRAGGGTLLLCFEVPLNTDVLPPKNTNKFSPDHLNDITPYVQTKIDALKAYQSELQQYPGPISVESVLKLSAKRAGNKRHKHVEAFERIM